MSNTDGENATYERLEKDVAAVKNGISALSGQIADAIRAFADTATKPVHPGYKQARDNVDSMTSDASERGSTSGTPPRMLPPRSKKRWRMLLHNIRSQPSASR
jgi:hypothetical protein